MAATVTLRLNGAPQPVTFGERTSDALRFAQRAEAFATALAIFTAGGVYEGTDQAAALASAAADSVLPDGGGFVWLAGGRVGLGLKSGASATSEAEFSTVGLTSTELGFSALGSDLVADADAAAMRATLGMTAAGTAYGYSIFAAGVPFIYPSSGSFGNNGAVTLTTALPVTYPACFMYFPAGAIASGSAAGWYYTVMSSTTAGTVYNNAYAGGVPAVPASPAAFATTGPGAYTQTTGGFITAHSFTLPANALGLNGQLKLVAACRMPSNANNKLLAYYIGGSAMAQLTLTSATFGNFEGWTLASGASARQSSWASGSIGNSSGQAFSQTTQNLAISNTVLVRFFLNTATDYIIVGGLNFIIYPN